jgi:hypothetical protein
MTNGQSLVDINQASIEELTTINGIGENLAKRVVENRPYQALHDLVKVPGISETKLAALMPNITLSGTKPIKESTGKQRAKPKIQSGEEPVAKLGETEAFVFLEDRNERQDALLIIFGGFILGLIILLLRRASD